MGDIGADRAGHVNTTVWVADVLRTRIGAGDLPPGTKLSEQQLAASLQVSRNTLREAFTILANESIVTRYPNRGVFVASPDSGAVRDIYRMRRILEPAAVLWGPELDLARFDAVISEGAEAKSRGSIADMATANQNFHLAVVSMSGSPQLQQAMSCALTEMRLVFHAMTTKPDFHTRYADENAALVELLRAGRRPEAAAALRAYLDAAEAELLGYLEAQEHLGF